MESWKQFRLRVLFVVFLYWLIGYPAFASVPTDLEINGIAGGSAPGSENTYLQISADGQATYIRYLPDVIDRPYLEEIHFAINNSQLEQIWQAIQNNNFFNLNPVYANPSINDRTFANLMIVANGDTHRVTTRNIAVPPFDQIIHVINNTTPGSQDLEYDTSAPPTIIPIDVCERLALTKANSTSHTHLQFYKHAGKNRYDNSVSCNPCPHAVANGNTAPHPGTVVGYRMTLQEAIRRGIVKLTSKGDLYGDQMSIEIDNNGNEKTNELVVKLYLEFWGSGATAENVARIKNAIEGYWSDVLASDGQHITTEVATRIDQNATSPPGTPGYHQIELSGNTGEHHTTGGTVYGINHGTTSGKWGTESIHGDLAPAWAHEAGHLLDFDDQYERFVKTEAGWWESPTIKSTEGAMAITLDPYYPKYNASQIEAFLKTYKVGMHVLLPKAGYETDIMGGMLTGQVLQSHADIIANSNPGIIVEIPAGSLLLNKDGGSQNFITTRTIDVFVPAGQKKTLKGLYVACIDSNDGIPYANQVFDVAPTLGSWSSNKAATYLKKLVQYIDANDRYCEFDEVTQMAIWRITNDDFIGDSEVENYLLGADIVLGDTLLGFPRLSNPDSMTTSSGFIIPPELLSVSISPLSLLTSIGQSSIISSTLPMLEIEGATTAYTWTLEKPEGSTLDVSNIHTAQLTFVPDVRGFYAIGMNADITIPTVDGSTTYSRQTSNRVTVADIKTETFENFFIENTPPFFWKTSGDQKWMASGYPYTGVYSVQSPLLSATQSSTLEVSYTAEEAGQIAFAFQILATGYSETHFTFAIDGSTLGTWSGSMDWTRISFDVDAGQHTFSWKADVIQASYGISDFFILDDVFFPTDEIDVSIPSDSQIPNAFGLYQNYPNPFNSSTIIAYDLSEPAHVTIMIYDIQGRIVLTLVDDKKQAGHHKSYFKAHDLSSGLYLVKINAGSFTDIKKLIFMK